MDGWMFSLQSSESESLLAWSFLQGSGLRVCTECLASVTLWKKSSWHLTKVGVPSLLHMETYYRFLSALVKMKDVRCFPVFTGHLRLMRN